MRANRFVVALALIPLGVSAVVAQSNGVREVSASGRSLIPLTTKIRYTTMVLLPDQEEILDVVCGDDFWIISATQNIAHIKPAKEGVHSSYNHSSPSGSLSTTPGCHRIDEGRRRMSASGPRHKMIVFDGSRVFSSGFRNVE